MNSQSLNIIGERTIIFSSKHQAKMTDTISPDMGREQEFIRLFDQVKPYTMTSVEALFALYSSVNYVLDRGIPGDFVECGVWRGGSSLLVALILQREESSIGKLCFTTRSQECLRQPSLMWINTAAQDFEMMEDYADDIGWCYASLEDVSAVFKKQAFNFPVEFIEGDVMTTLQNQQPSSISLLRLDTDWYESTALEYELLYPKLSTGGVLIIDDYGVWAGSRKATDDYFAKIAKPLIIRIDKEVRLAVKL